MRVQAGQPLASRAQAGRPRSRHCAHLGAVPSTCSPSRVDARSSAFCGTSAQLLRNSAAVRVSAPRAQPRRTVARQDIASCPVTPVVNARGWVFPVSPLGTVASVFAVLDDKQVVQFIGFSKDLRNTLRALIGRRPHLVHSFRAFHHAIIDEQDLQQQRSAWIKELGYTPMGNSDPVEQALWQSPVNCGSPEKAQTAYDELLIALRARGVTEEMSPDLALLAQGKLDICVSSCNTEEALSASAAKRTSTNLSRTVTMEYPGAQASGWLEHVSADVFFKNSYITNGGHMFDVLLTPSQLLGGVSTTHRVIVGREYPAKTGKSPEELVCIALAWLLHTKATMAPEGILDNGTFPAAYFNLSLVEQWWPEFGHKHQLLGTAAFWRFNRIHNYGAAAERTDSLMLGPGHLSS